VIDPRRMNFRLKLVLGTNFVVLAVTLLTIAVVAMAVKQKVGVDCASERVRTTRIVEQYLSATREQLDKGVALLAGASDFQALVATDGIDAETLLYSLNGFQSILGCDTIVLTDPEGRVRARTDGAKAGQDNLSGVPAVKDAIGGKAAGCLWRDGNRTIQAVARPVIVGEQVVGCIVAGVELGAKSAETLKGMLDREVVVVRGEHLVTSTFEGPDAAALAGLAKDPALHDEKAKELVTQDLGLTQVLEDDYQVLGVQLAPGDSGLDPIGLFLLAPEERILGFYHRTQRMLIILGLTAQVLGYALAHVLATVVVVRPIRATVARLKDVAQGDGDLTRRLEVKGTDEIGELGKWFNLFVKKMEGVIAEVKVGAGNIDAGVSQIAGASKSLAEGASEQAGNLQQISGSLEKMSEQISQSAQRAREACKLAEESKVSADQGQSEMAQMNKAVNEIKQSSSEIGKIIHAIDEIAFQTNLLALNAAVEAARAGEAGKGFAVVAEEVRNLAKRSAEAARNTATMIEASVTRSNNGVQIAQRVESALKEITTRTTQVSKLLAQSATASAEQATGIGQVSEGVGQLDGVTQQTAGNSEELASSASQMSSQVAALNALVGQFRVSDGAELAAADSDGFDTTSIEADAVEQASTF
jgi:methyl-accepting chemotaxis protein